MKTDQKMQDCRREYEAVEVPQEAKERILMGIERAKKEQEEKEGAKCGRRAGGRIWRYAGLAAAACFGAIVILANSGQSVALAMEKIPVIGAIAKVVTFRTYEDQTNHFSAHIEVPQVEQEQLAETQPADESAGDTQPQGAAQEELQRTNKTIEEYGQELIARYEHDLSESQGEGNYSLQSDYKVVSESDDYLAIEVDTLLIMASGSEYRKTFNIDKNTGEILSLKDFFREGSDYIGVISDAIKAQMKQQMEQDDSVIYWLDSEVPEWDFQAIDDDTSFYFDGQGDLVIQFDEYEVAPGSMGAVSFTIPRADLDDILK